MNKRDCDVAKAAGLCTICLKVPSSGDTLECDNCRIGRSESGKTRKKRYRLEGRCVRCGAANPNAPDRAMCPECLSDYKRYNAAKARKHAAAGKCRDCGRDTSAGRRMCDVCLKRGKSRHKRLLATVIAAYGGKCVCFGCDVIEPMFLTVDHTNGGGTKHRKSIGKCSSGFYLWIIKNDFPKDFQILCWNCNCGRARNGGICPHPYM